MSNQFQDYEISDSTIHHLRTCGMTQMMPIQYKSFDHIYNGLNVIGKDKTGSGKTLAYTLPIMERKRKNGHSLNGSAKKPWAIIITPTRELATQIEAEIKRICVQPREFQTICIYG